MRQLALILVTACGSTSTAPSTPIANATKSAGSVGCTETCLPDVTFEDLGTGDTYDRRTFANKVVVINFFSTWSKPSRTELPMLGDLSAAYRDQVEFIGVLTSDEARDEELAMFRVDHQVIFPVVDDTPAVLAAFDYPQSVPTTFIYDRTGARAAKHVGMYSQVEITAILDKLVTQ